MRPGMLRNGLCTCPKSNRCSRDKLVKSLKFRHAPAFAGAGSAKAGIQNYLKHWFPVFAGMTAKDGLRLFAKPSYDLVSA
jgi:hypothetical protein